MRTCPNCGESNPDRARFCLACGSAIGGGSDEERKVVTVLSCDLVGFTQRSDRADPEDVKDTLRTFHARLKREIEDIQGTVDQFIGDAVIGVFGAPVAHEDDPERAIRASLRILEAIADLNEGDPDRELSVRIGIESGEALVALGGPDTNAPLVTGDVVARANRLQSQAPPDGILVGARAYESAAPNFEWDAPDEMAEGMAWIPRSARSLPGTDPRRRQSTPLVGRVEELALLKAAYRRTVREATVQLVTLAGEPGIGKSRMIAELASYLDELPELIRWRKGRCLPYGDGVSFWALGEIVKQEAGILESDDPELAGKKLRGAVDAVFADDQDAGWIAGRLSPLVGLGTDESGDRESAFVAWRRFLEALAADAPTVLVVEDIHWADAAMLEFVDGLVDRLAGVPLLVVCAARPELFAQQPGWGGGKRNSSTVSLSPLTDAETQMLLIATLDEPPPPEAASAILDRAGGNPLYAEEFARMVAERGETGGAIPVPPTVQALIAARIDALEPEPKALLHDAAVLGREFWPSALAAMGGRPEDEIVDRLREIVRKELVRPRRTSRIRGQREYTFWHAIVRDVAESQIPRADRAQKHLAAARWIETVTGERLADQADALAHHYRSALELTPANEPSRPGLRAKTAQALTLAGDRAMRLDGVRAERTYTEALELLPDEDPDRARLSVKAANAAELVGNFEVASRRFREAIERFRAAGDRLAVGEATALLGRAVGIQARGDEGMALLQEAVALLSDEAPGPELVLATSRLSGQCLIAGRYEEGLGHARRALDLAQELGLEAEEVRALQYRGALRVELGDTDGLEDLRHALDLALERGFGDEAAIAWGNLAYETWLHEGPRTAVPIWRAADAFSSERGYPAHHRWSQAGQLECLYDLLAWDEGLAIARDMASWDAEHGRSQIGLYARTFEVSVLTLRQQTDEASEKLEELLPHARESGMPEHVGMAALAASALATQREDRGSALAFLDEFASATQDAGDFRANNLPSVIRVLIQIGAIDRIDGFLIPEENVSSPRHRLAIATAWAMRSLFRRELDDAVPRLEDVRERWRRMDVSIEEALAAAALGQAYALSGRGSDASEAFGSSKQLLAIGDARWPLAVIGALERSVLQGEPDAARDAPRMKR
ncbi:MAG: AAA family ATPase [Actinomycetota bacterium]